MPHHFQNQIFKNAKDLTRINTQVAILFDLFSAFFGDCKNGLFDRVKTLPDLGISF